MSRIVWSREVANLGVSRIVVQFRKCCHPASTLTWERSAGVLRETNFPKSAAAIAAGRRVRGRSHLFSLSVAPLFYRVFILDLSTTSHVGNFTKCSYPRKIETGGRSFPRIQSLVEKLLSYWRTKHGLLCNTNVPNIFCLMITIVFWSTGDTKFWIEKLRWTVLKMS